MKKKIFTSFIILSWRFIIVNSIKCHSCVGLSNVCDVSKSKTFPLKHCDEDIDFCLTAVMGDATHFGCGEKNVKENCPGSKLLSTCFCKKDGCNGVEGEITDPSTEPNKVTEKPTTGGEEEGSGGEETPEEDSTTAIAIILTISGILAVIGVIFLILLRKRS